MFLRAVSALSVCVVLLGCCASSAECVKDFAAFAKDNLCSEIQTVKIGYYESSAEFQDGFGNSERKSGYAYEYYQKIALFTGWKYEYVYGSFDEIIQKLEDCEVDIVAGLSPDDFKGKNFVFSSADMGINEKPVYFAANRKNSEIIDSLDDAVVRIEDSFPDFTSALNQKYYYRHTKDILTEQEKNWLDGRTLTVGYIDDNLPFSDNDDGKPDGIAGDVMETLRNFLNVEVVPVCYESTDEMENALKNNEVDTIFPSYSDLWLNEQKGFMQTEPFISDRLMIVYREQYRDDIMSRVAVCDTGISRKYYPDSEVMFYENIPEMLNAVKDGEALCAVGCSSIIQRFLMSNIEYNDLNIAYLESNQEFGFAVNVGDNILLPILNKAVSQIDSASLTSSLVYHSGVKQEFSVKDLIIRNAVFVVIVSVLIVAAIVLIFLYYYRKTKMFNKVQARTRCELQNALRQANEANSAKTTFLSSMSHDIRTPMNAIAGMSVIALNHIDDRERVLDCLHKIEISSRHLLTLINDVLDISKIESGNLTLNPTVFSLKEMIDTLVNIIRPQAVAKNIDFSVNMHDIKYDLISADEVRLNQIFINILTNAVKYTDEGGTVRVEICQRQLDNSRLRLTYIVEDNGMGMTEDFMKNMYTTFSRAQDSRINKVQGTGLGLAIVRRIVDMMFGSIECESEPDKGTKFTVKIDVPFSREDRKEKENPDEEKPKKDDFFEGMRFLVAEDNDLNWEVISELLNMYKISSDHAENGKICVDMLEAAEEGFYTAVLMDIQMPIMNGRDATKEIRKSEKEWVRKIPIIAMTADAFAEDISASIDAGMDGHVSKPVELDNLFQELRKIIYRS